MRRTILLAAAAAALALAGCEQASMENYAATEDAEAGAPLALEMIRPPEEGGRAAGDQPTGRPVEAETAARFERGTVWVPSGDTSWVNSPPR